MMNVGAALSIAWLSTLLAAGVARAETQPQNNPFRKPQLLQLERTAAAPSVRPATTLPDLRATLVGGATPLALIGDEIVGVGAEIDGYRLVAVREGVAVFERDGVKAEIEVRREEPDNTQDEPDED